ncbi:RING finger protein 10-like isoform X2 [Ctenocephalides felis]|uniref:RING finger protein 10-like isoform X2 n=1 Tax=Ctenocephalides felis TaxID=7515 RepID=UPI000E6E344F|nr:RING finger protein 10-like isoform X2 [Ctenocephalides felis]
MQQEMEKKTLLRPNQPPGKGQGAESKKNQDVPNSKPWTKGLRNNNIPNNPKPPPQRNKYVGFDKRPRPRGGSQMGGKAETRLEFEQLEPGSVMKFGNKKQSLNHLLNFHYTPRSVGGPTNYGRQYKKGKINYPKYNKEHYLQANCQFIVREGEDYSICLKNPDALVEWDYIEQIITKSEDPPHCPICLEEPLAGRITRCGHIYCYPCILHYLALSDKPWRKCPICYEAIHLKDLKSVCWAPIATFGLNSTITLQLMRRPRNCNQAWPVDSTMQNNLVLPNISDGPIASKYCKLLQANLQQILDMINVNLADLNRVYKIEEFTPEACFIQQAIDLLNQYQADKLNSATKIKTKSNDFKQQSLDDSKTQTADEQNLTADSFKQLSLDDQKLTKCAPEELSLNENVTGNEAGEVKHLENVFGADNLDEIQNSILDQIEQGVDCVGEDVASGIEVLDGTRIGESGSGDKDFYFYQALDGQHIYLAGLCARILEYSYGSLANCPKTITTSVEAREVLTVTEELRKRLRYLEHLPITCQIELVELKLRPPIVSPESLEYFHNQLETRRRLRLRKCREENRRDMQITIEQERKQRGLPIAGSSQTNREINWESDFPTYGSPQSVGNESDSLDHQASGVDNLGTSPGPSFATMLTMARSPSQGTDFIRQNKWAALPSQQQTDSINVEQDPDYDPNYVPAPSYTQSFRDAISQAMEKSCQSNGATKENASKKSKKKKKQILFATGMNFQV